MEGPMHYTRAYLNHSTPSTILNIIVPFFVPLNHYYTKYILLYTLYHLRGCVTTHFNPFYYEIYILHSLYYAYPLFLPGRSPAYLHHLNAGHSTQIAQSWLLVTSYLPHFNYSLYIPAKQWILVKSFNSLLPWLAQKQTLHSLSLRYPLPTSQHIIVSFITLYTLYRRMLGIWKTL